MTSIAVRCPHCHSEQIVKRGKTRRGTQRYLCQNTACTCADFTRQANAGIVLFEGQIAARKGDYATARSKAEESKKLALRIVIDKPESKSLDQALLLCAKASEEMKEPAQAIGYYRKLLTDRPKSDCVAAARERLQALGAPAETGKKD